MATRVAVESNFWVTVESNFWVTVESNFWVTLINFWIIINFERPSDHRFETELVKSPESYGNSELP